MIVNSSEISFDQISKHLIQYNSGNLPVLLLRQVSVNVIDAYDFSMVPFSFVNPPTCLFCLFFDGSKNATIPEERGRY